MGVDSRVSGFNRGWFVVAALSTTWMVIFGIQYSFGIFFRSLQEAFQCSRGTISWVMTVHLIVFALFMVPAGWINDRFNLRIVTSAAAFAFGLALALCSLVSEPWQLYVLYGLMGVSTSICGPPLFAVVLRWFPEKSGLALGFTTAGVGLGGLLLAPIGNALIASYGWRSTFVIWGVGSAIIMLACAQFMKNPPAPQPGRDKSAADKPAGGERAPRPNPPPAATFGQAIRTKEILFIILAAASAQITSRMVFVHIAPHALDMGISPFAAAMALSTLGCGSLVGRLAMGFVQDRIGAKRSMIICLVTMGVCLFGLPFIASDAAFFVFAVLFGLALGGDTPQVPALTVQCFGMASLGVIYGFVAGAVHITASLGPLVAGYMFDLTHSYTLTFLGGGVLLFLGVFSISRIR
ncbi:MAG: MFS transporter [Deltaproteobacteria bacterium]|nr:MFS transporter [Deltaproteobacteria bacterium]